VNKTSSSELDQLRLQFQQERNDTVSSISELHDLRKLLNDAQRRFSDERRGRLKLEEWTEYIERELETYLKSRKDDEKRYQNEPGASISLTTKALVPLPLSLPSSLPFSPFPLPLGAPSDDDDFIGIAAS